MAAILASPGAWNASDAFEPWLRAVMGGRLESDHGLAAAIGRSRAEVDWSLLPGDAEPRMVVAHPNLVHALPRLLALLPDALVVHVHRSPGAAIAEATDALAAAANWVAVTETILQVTATLPADRVVVTSVETLLAEPQQELQRLLGAIQLGWHGRLTRVWIEQAARLRTLGRGSTGLERLSADHDLTGRVIAVDARVRTYMPEPSPRPDAPAAGSGGLTAIDEGFGKLLSRLGSSVLVSTYQTNRLISLRAVDGNLGVHLRNFQRPMGMAALPNGLALGTRSEVIEFRNIPEAAADLEPPGAHDGCYLPRSAHVTGDIAVHDLAWGDAGLWVVATKFNCLATLDAEHSFVPRWRPPFISALVPEDRCHLNGVAVVEGLPRYVTALGTTDEPGGWRRDKAAGGVLMEVPSGRIVVDGLSMPHSPRWHRGTLWVLESGRGRLLEIEPTSGESRVVAELPGFARGLALHDGIAFVGTSQARETAVFGGLPIADLADPVCAVWAVALKTGRVVASVRFEDQIQELFDVSLLAGVRYPEVVEWGAELARNSWSVPAQHRGGR